MHETSCRVCGKNDKVLNDRRWECSHVDCPNRKPKPEPCDHQNYMGEGCYRVRPTSQE